MRPAARDRHDVIHFPFARWVDVFQTYAADALVAIEDHAWIDVLDERTDHPRTARLGALAKYFGMGPLVLPTTFARTFVILNAPLSCEHPRSGADVFLGSAFPIPLSNAFLIGRVMVTRVSPESVGVRCSTFPLVFGDFISSRSVVSALT